MLRRHAGTPNSPVQDRRTSASEAGIAVTRNVALVGGGFGTMICTANVDPELNALALVV
jgi:hypothetical protein